MATLGGAALSQTSQDPLIKQNFKEDIGGWTSLGPAAKVSLTHASPIGSGMGGGNALQYDYKVEKGEVDALLLPTPVGSLSKAQSIKFRLMSDSATMFAVALQEQDGGRYVALCTVPKGAWQSCEFSVDDFHLAQEANDPKDPDGKLDLDQVTGVAIIDLAEIFAGGDNPDLIKLVNVQKGNHSLFIDQFSIEKDAVAARSTVTKGVVCLDTFCHPQLDWFGIGNIGLSQTSDSPLSGVALKWVYKQENTKFAGVSLDLNPGILKGTQSLSFDLASIRGGTLRVQIEELGGIKFSTSVDIPSGSKPKNISLNFSDFRSTEDSADPKAKLDLTKVKTLLLMDMSGVMSEADADHPDNTLWINHLIAK